MDVERNVVYRCRKTRAVALTVLRLAYDKAGRRRSVPGSLSYAWPRTLTLRGEAVNAGTPLALSDPEGSRRSVVGKMLLKGVQIRASACDVDVQLAFALKPDSFDVSVVSEKLEELIGDHAETCEALRKRVAVCKVNASSAERRFEDARKKVAEAQTEYDRARNATVPIYLNDPDRARREQLALDRLRERLQARLRRAEKSLEKAGEDNTKAAAALEQAVNEQQAKPEPEVFARDVLADLEPVLRNVRPVQVLDAWGAPVLVLKVMVDQEIVE